MTDQQKEQIADALREGKTAAMVLSYDTFRSEESRRLAEKKVQTIDAVLALLAQQETPSPECSTVSCCDCGAPYGADGWCDVVVPNDTWAKISPSGGEGGILCFRCMTRRIEALAMDDVPVIIASGPYSDDDERWRMIGWKQGYRVAQQETPSPERTPCECRRALEALVMEHDGFLPASERDLIGEARAALASPCSCDPEGKCR